MAKYNTFVVVDCKKRKNVLTTSSARKARELFKTGIKIEVWNENKRIDVLYFSKHKELLKYVYDEIDYIRNKQLKAEKRNRHNKKI